MIVASETEKYNKVWDLKKYRVFSPGLDMVEQFMSIMQPDPGASVIDIGCGAGVAGLEFEKRGLDIWYMDLTDRGLKPEVNRERFIAQPIWDRWSSYYGYGYCCDVMEHIPPEYTMLCVERILESCGKTWFTISNLPDNFGAHVGETLHLTVRPYSWWLDRLNSLGNVVDARDLCGASLFVVTR